MAPAMSPRFARMTPRKWCARGESASRSRAAQRGLLRTIQVFPGEEDLGSRGLERSGGADDLDAPIEDLERGVVVPPTP